MSEARFDCLVIGGGSGGLAAARRAAAHGAKVALVEAGRLGGTCVHAGCIPKKLLWIAAELALGLDDAEALGFELARRALDWGRFTRAIAAHTASLGVRYARHLETEGVQRIEGRARLLGPGVVDVEGRRFEARHVVLATGGAPRIPELPGAELGITSDALFTLPELPRRLCVVGGGYIGVEAASIFRALGSEVTLATRRSHPLHDFGATIREALAAELSALGLALAPGLVPAALEQNVAGLFLHGANGERLGPFDRVLWAIGRAPATSSLGLETAGVSLGSRGEVVVDAFQDTTLPGIHAVGDVTGGRELTPVAIAEGRRLADRLFGGRPDSKLDHDDVPTVVFSLPPVGTVGLSLEAARARHGEPVRAYRSTFTATRYALTRRRPRTTVELVVAGPDERVVGVHVVGAGADELLQGFAVALKLGARKVDLDRTVAIHPTTAEELVTLR
ncbi:MAG: glutathione-disulfide reductase [Deltaproteobacteria bacterium]|nr:glutathione-disulfide reductase [Deltaproteobacteria bacterium]